MPPVSSAQRPVEGPDQRDSERPSTQAAEEPRQRREVPIAHVPPPDKLPDFLQAPSGRPEEYPATPLGLIRATITKQSGLILTKSLISAIYWSAGAVLFWALGRALDSGLQDGLTSRLWGSVGIMIAAIVVEVLCQGMELLDIGIWRNGFWGPMRRGAFQIFPRRTNLKTESGDIVSALTWDAERIANFAQYVPDVIGSSVSMIVVLVLMFEQSVPLGWVCTIGLPVILLGIGAIAPALSRATQAMRRERGKLTTIATDTAVGLRVLRGIGGEDYYNERYQLQSKRLETAGIRAAKPMALLGTMVSGGPFFFSAVVASLGLWFAYEGTVTPGQLVSFWALVTYLVTPIRTISDALRLWTTARVSAGRFVELLRAEPLLEDSGALTEPDWPSVTLVDETSGVTVEPGRLTAIVDANQEEAGAIARRLARIDPGAVRVESASPRCDPGTGAGRAADSLDDIPLEQVRHAIIYSGPVAELFTGTLRSNLLGAAAWDTRPRTIYEMIDDILNYRGEAGVTTAGESKSSSDDPRLREALAAANAGDAVTSVGGLSGHLSERGRNLSGGQRQRVALARALVQSAPVEVLVDPTSAVDSHTEARIAESLADYREGRTTVVVTTSPLVLDRADVALFVQDGRVVAEGTHEELLANPGYRAVVDRAVGVGGASTPPTATETAETPEETN